MLVRDAERTGGAALAGIAAPMRPAHGAVGSAGPLTAIGAHVLVLVAVLALRDVASLVVPVLFGLFPAWRA